MSNNVDNEHDEDFYDEENEENEMDDDDEITDSIPSCPYCNDDSANCKHVILHYDASFQEFLSGFLTNKGDEFFDKLHEQLDKYIKNGIQKKHRDKELNNFISYAVKTYDKTTGYYCFDMQLFLNTLHIYINENGGEYENYSDSGSAALYCSSYDIYYAKNPEKLLKKFIKFLSDEFNK